LNSTDTFLYSIQFFKKAGKQVTDNWKIIRAFYKTPLSYRHFRALACQDNIPICQVLISETSPWWPAKSPLLSFAARHTKIHQQHLRFLRYSIMLTASRQRPGFLPEFAAA
jgi:hypothetical protein